MRIEPPPRPSGSLVPPLGHVQKTWLPLTSLLFLLVLLIGVVGQFELAAADQTAAVPAKRVAPKSGH